MMDTSPKGLTLLEGLIFGGIVVVLLFATGVMVSSARSRARDFKRLSDVSRMQSALELYFNDTNAYPKTESDPIVLGDSGVRCLNAAGFQPSCASSGRVYLNPVPSQTDIGLKGSQLQVYAYQSDGERYVMSFVIERSIPQAQVEKGVVCAKPGRAFYATTRNICSLD